MKKIIAIGLIGVALVTNSATANAKEWSLQECIAYALQNNISLQKSNLSRLNAKEDILLSKAQLFPSLSASTNQMANYTPWVESGITISILKFFIVYISFIIRLYYFSMLNIFAM